jgi:hypothetical protein
LQQGQEQGLQQAEAKYQPIVEALAHEIEELRRKLREAGIGEA